MVPQSSGFWVSSMSSGGFLCSRMALLRCRHKTCWTWNGRTRGVSSFIAPETSLFLQSTSAAVYCCTLGHITQGSTKCVAEVNHLNISSELRFLRLLKCEDVWPAINASFEATEPDTQSWQPNSATCSHDALLWGRGQAGLPCRHDLLLLCARRDLVTVRRIWWWHSVQCASSFMACFFACLLTNANRCVGLYRPGRLVKTLFHRCLWIPRA